MRKRILQLGKVGRLDLFCAVLQEDRSLVTRSRIIARLKEFDLFLITDKPIEPKNVDLLMLVEKDPSLEFSPATITIFIENNYPAIAEEMISFHLEPSSNQLSEINSNSIWYLLGFSNIKHVETALAIGVAPTSYFRKALTDLLEPRRYVRIDRWTTVQPVRSSEFNTDAVFTYSGPQISQHLLLQAISTGRKEYVKYLLEKWCRQLHCLNESILGVTVFHNAYMLRDWDLVKMLWELRRKWTRATHQHFSFKKSPSLPAPYPQDVNDQYFFLTMPHMIKLGVYPADIYSRSLERVGLISLASAKRLISLGAVVTQKALYLATKLRSSTVMLLYLLNQYKLDSNDEFEYFGRIVEEMNCVDNIFMIIWRGIPITLSALLALYRTKRGNSFVVQKILGAVKDGNPLRETFLESLEEDVSSDIRED
ncbi:hypothetical protein HDU99_001130, partial [Rhizoclosmatium hyalinum]